MAIQWYYRVGFMVSSSVFRYAFQGGSTDSSPFWAALNGHWTEALDPLVDPLTFADTLTAEMPEGTYVAVADVEAPFELRKLQVRWDRTPPAGTVQDVDVCTFHFLKLSGGEPTNSWDPADYAAVESAFLTYWGNIKSGFPTWQHLDQFRWYADGPAFYHLDNNSNRYVPNGDNPARRVTEEDVAGTGSGSALPPQDSLTVTEVVSHRKSWGRWYLPAGSASSILNTDGRAVSSVISTYLGHAVTMYNTCRAANLIPVVFSIQKPERPKKPSGTLPAVGAIAYEVTSLQMDDLFDVIRSRRYDAAVSKPRTALT